MSDNPNTSNVVEEMLSSNSRGKQGWIVLIVAWALFLIPIPFVGTIFGGVLVLVALILAMIQLERKDGGLGLLLAALIGSPIVYFIGLAVMAAFLSS